MAVRNSRASAWDRGSSGEPTNSEKDGTAFSLSLKYVGRRFVTGSDVEVSVAKALEDIDVVEGCRNERVACRSGGAFKHLKRVETAAIEDIWRLRDYGVFASTIS